MTRLNIVSSIDDVELNAIRCAIASFENVRGLDELLALLRRRCVCGDRIETVDLIGHSVAPGFVVLGNWTIDDSPQTVATFTELLRDPMRGLGVRRIRLLGCSTAVTERGRYALRQLARVTGCNVSGTTRYISRHDYAAEGFVSEDVVVPGLGKQQKLALIRRHIENPARSS